MKPPIHFYCVLHVKKKKKKKKKGGGGGEGVQLACTIAYVINGRPLRDSTGGLELWFSSSEEVCKKKSGIAMHDVKFLFFLFLNICFLFSHVFCLYTLSLSMLKHEI